MNGLDTSIIAFSSLPNENPKLRLDSEFQSKPALNSIAAVRSNSHQTIAEIAPKALKGRNIPYEPDGLFGVVRSGDITETFQPDSLLRSSSQQDAFFLRKNDVLISSIGQGSIGKIQLFRHPGQYATVSEVTVVRTINIQPAYVAAFLSSDFGQAQIHRYVTGATGQLHLYPSDVQRIYLPTPSHTLQTKIQSLYDMQWDSYQASEAAQAKAQNTILSEIGLGDWSPPNPLTYVSKASEVFAAARADAQYFRPLYKEVEERLASKGNSHSLRDILKLNTRGKQPSYGEKGLPVINSKHVRTNRVILSGNRYASITPSSHIIKKGDVLINGTGEGTLGRAAPYLHDQESLPDNHVTILRSNEIDPVYLAVFLNSPLGQWQVERHIKGSSGQIELYPTDIDKVIFWNAPSNIQQSVRNEIQSAFDEEKKANAFLDIAKRAVEISISTGESSALDFIQTQLETIE